MRGPGTAVMPFIEDDLLWSPPESASENNKMVDLSQCLVSIFYVHIFYS